MNREISPYWFVLVVVLIGIGFGFYIERITRPTPENNKRWHPTLPKCRYGWYINRRLGFDEFLGDVSEDYARKVAGENIIYKGMEVGRCN